MKIGLSGSAEIMPRQISFSFQNHLNRPDDVSGGLAARVVFATITTAE